MAFVASAGDGPLQVEVNGTSIAIETGDAHEFSEFFAPLDAQVPASLLRANNTISVTAQAGATVTSVQLVTHRTAD